jgi:hypothetical protein
VKRHANPPQLGLAEWASERCGRPKRRTIVTLCIAAACQDDKGTDRVVIGHFVSQVVTFVSLAVHHVVSSGASG